MKFNEESFKKALSECKIIRWQNHFKNIVKAYLKAESEQYTIPNVSGSFPFDKDLFEKAMTADKPYYAMGVDTYDKGNLAYCLTRKIDGVVEVLLSKTMRDETKFKQEVGTLASCFDADVFKSGD